MLKFLVAIWVLSGIFASMILIGEAYRKIRPPACDSCKHLKTKDGGIFHRRYCEESIDGHYYGSRYCFDWEPREKGGEGHA